MKVKPVHKRYSDVLRVIGQDLAELFPARFEIETDGKTFVTRGRSRTGSSTNHGEGRRLLRIWKTICQPDPQPQSSRVGFMRIYTPDDINQLQKIGRARRLDATQDSDLYTLAERLRIVGAIIDEEGGELVRLCEDSNNLSCKYRDREGNLHFEQYSSLSLYKLRQHHFSQKQSQRKLWRRVMR